MRARRRGQGGFTLVELIITLALASLLMTALVSVMLTTFRASSIASSRVDASSQIRNFELFAYDDITTVSVSSINPCASSCTTPLTVGPVTYSWNSSTNFLDRVTSQSSRHVASNVTAFAWHVDPNATVVVSLTVTFQNYAESQTFRFYPRLNP